MSVLVFNRKGRPVTLLSPKEKNQKFKTEMKHNFRLTNNGELKDHGLTDAQKAYRAGYRECYKDCAKVYHSKYVSQFERRNKK